MDSRQYGKRFPGCLEENARPSLSIGVGLFILERQITLFNMFALHSIRISLATLILCLCLGNLFVLPGMNAAVVTVLDLPAIESENIQPLEYDAENDDDFAFLPSLKSQTADALAQKSRGMNLDFESASIASLLPPPKHT